MRYPDRCLIPALYNEGMKTVADRTDTRKARWERETLEPALKKAPERQGPFTTISGRPI